MQAQVTADASDRNWYGVSKMLDHVSRKWKLQPGDMHDALLHASIAVPQDPSMLAYLNMIFEHCSSAEQMQYHQRRKSIKTLKDIQKCFQRGGAYFGSLSLKGKSQQAMLAQRVAGIIGVLLQQAQRTEASDAVATEPDKEDDFDDEEAARASKKPRLLDLRRREYGAMPQEAAITTAQAESALNHNAATEHGEEDDGNVPDNDVLAEMEALAGLDLNPPMLDYACHAVELEQ